MSNWYRKNVTKVGQNTLNLNSLTTPTLIALEAGLYTFSQAHEFLSDVPAGARLATQAITTVTFGSTNDGALECSDVTFTTPTAGKTVDAFIIFDDTTVETTSPLIAYINAGTGIPIITQSGRDLSVAWSSGIAAYLG